MGAGRKTQTFIVSESNSRSPGNSAILTRNLRKSDLGGVIFGCKHETMQECLHKQLFGLPRGHFSYVSNIKEGMPLFLFNFSDRKLHGIYEAASHGQLSFDAYAWTDGGSERTAFPAQVYIRVRMQCHPLTENQFKQIIADNYFSTSHFWFELDHTQTTGLIRLFKPPPPTDAMLSPIVQCRKGPLPALPFNKGASFSRTERSTSFPATKWKEIDYKDSRSIADQNLCANSPNDNKLASGGDIKNAGHIKKNGTGFEDTDSKGTVSDWEDLSEDANHNPNSIVKLDGLKQSSQMQQSDTLGLENEEERVLRLLQKLATEREHLKSSSSGELSVGSECPPGTSEDVQSLNLPDDNFNNADDVGQSSMDDINPRNTEMMEVIEELRQRTSILEMQRVEQDQEMDALRNVISDAGRTIQVLQDRVKELESRIVPSVRQVELEVSIDKHADQYFGPDDVIYLIGGFDGCSWLSALDCFSPSLDKITPLKSMSSARSYASAVPLDGILYVFGGGDGNLWFDSVECYNRKHDNWTSCPSMLREKGSLAGATLNGKIFAIGGGDGVECFSDFEMFDPARELWINNHPMLHTRFAPAAAELNGAIYALGGYDGNAYLRSVERFDPREGTWTEVPSMNIRRGCHSVSVFNEKLYCVGGYDGEQMVPSMEVFDPRLDCWVLGEPMKSQRGYAAAAVLGNSIFAIGGVFDEKNNVDTVECYREGAGWIDSGWKAIGKRCFCSAVVL